ncbi:MAG: uroporphyrinogen decarboxylase [Alphaproteobacteria bacterium]|nr:uroporphyrinogen decarboxylase [Alphaproteobacteria bacterium]
MKLLLDTLLSKQIFTPTPVWMMRQAGRYLSEYRKVRQEAGSFLDLAYNSDLAAEVTLQPIRRYQMDGAILFSDILIVPHALGQGLRFAEGEGPLMDRKDLAHLSLNQVDDNFSKICETVFKVREVLEKNHPQTTMIGFAGAPWTVACYMVQGHGKSNFPAIFELIESDPKELDRILNLVVEATVIYLKGQVKAGAEVLKLFDSWAGLIKDKALFERFCIDPVKVIISEVKKEYPDTPFIGFPRHVPVEWLEEYCQKTGIDGLSVGEDINMSEIKTDIVLQGNLDNQVLLSGGDGLKQAVEKICSEMKGRPFIFNLGHGIIKETPPSHIQDVLNVLRH